MLHQIILKKGLGPKDADQAQLDRVLHGLNHPIVLACTVVACTVHAEIVDNRGIKSETKELTPLDIHKPVVELGPTQLMAQVAQALTQMYHKLM